MTLVLHYNQIKLTRHNVTWKVFRETHDTELQEIDERLHSLNENEVSPTTISNHDIHQYTICYALLSAAIIGMSVWITRKLVNYYRTKHNGITTHTNEAFELEEMKTHYGVGQEHTAPAQPPAPRPRESRPPTPATAAPKKNHVTFTFDD